MGANVKMAAFVKAFLLPYAAAGHKNKEGAVERPVWVQFGHIHFEKYILQLGQILCNSEKYI